MAPQLGRLYGSFLTPGDCRDEEGKLPHLIGRKAELEKLTPLPVRSWGSSLPGLSAACFPHSV